MSKTVRFITFLNIGFLSLLLVSCSTTPKNAEPTNIDFPQEIDSQDEIILPLKNAGKIKLNDGCIYLQIQKRKYVLIWPSYARLQDNGNTIQVSTTKDATSYAKGSSIEVGKEAEIIGARIDRPFTDDIPNLQLRQNKSCKADGYVFVRKWRRL